MKVIITDIENFDLPVGEDVQIVGPDLGNGNIKNCIGCFCCWHKTPGECMIHDGYERTGAKLGHCVSLLNNDSPDFADGCQKDTRICCDYLVSALQRQKDRITVILVNEELGY